jgi:indole-3-glycerol phosphate synthase
MDILTEILRHKRNEIKHKRNSLYFKEIKSRVKDLPPTKPLKTAIRRTQGQPLKLIAEIKKASPSTGVIREDFNPSEIIDIYEKKGVDAISILTDEHFFQGSLEHLNTARHKTQRPLLRKDFIFDELQIYESRVNGADAILLIIAILEKSQLIDLQGLSKELSLECLVEVHNLKELDTALYCGAEIIGINNRDLKTLAVNLSTTFDLLKDVPEDRIIVSESGINTRNDVRAIESTRVDAILVGTTLIKADDIGAKIDELMGRPER